MRSPVGADGLNMSRHGEYNRGRSVADSSIADLSTSPQSLIDLTDSFDPDNAATTTPPPATLSPVVSAVHAVQGLSLIHI